ncbi:MAG: serine/threonine-protein phosphatase [Magnetococcales bacterium]|nr:serine/threonine-protein phosphatase [Magnetococcales bacterium]
MFDIHTQLISRIQDIIRSTAFHTHLFFDADATIYNLKSLFLRYYPELGESVGRLRATVASMLASGEFLTSDLVRTGEVLGGVDHSLERIKDIQRFLEREPPFSQPEVLCFNKGVEPNLVIILNFSRLLLSERLINTDPKYFYSIVTDVIDKNMTCHRHLYGKLHDMLAARLSQVRFDRNLTLGFSLTAILLMIGFITDFYRRNQQTLIDLVKSRKEVVVAMESLRTHRDQLAYERDIVERTLERINQTTVFDHEGGNWLSIPMERIAGDFLYSATCPDGVRYYMLGDFTGHGLPSALGSPMVADIFHTMTHKNFSPLAILAEINAKLHRKLPKQLYLAAAFFAYDPGQRRLTIWNCGIPELLHFRQGEFYRAYAANHIPLGILPEHELETVSQVADIMETDRVYVFSDGLVEARNSQGDMLGIDNLRNSLSRILQEAHPLQSILDEVRQYQSGPQSDDLTLLELVF